MIPRMTEMDRKVGKAKTKSKKMRNRLKRKIKLGKIRKGRHHQNKNDDEP